MQRLGHQTATAAAALGINRSVSGAGMCVAWVSGTGRAAWGRKERGFSLGFPMGFPFCFANVKAESDSSQACARRRGLKNLKGNCQQP